MDANTCLHAYVSSVRNIYLYSYVCLISGCVYNHLFLFREKRVSLQLCNLRRIDGQFRSSVFECISSLGPKHRLNAYLNESCRVDTYAHAYF